MNIYTSYFNPSQKTLKYYPLNYILIARVPARVLAASVHGTQVYSIDNARVIKFFKLNCNCWPIKGKNFFSTFIITYDLLVCVFDTPLVNLCLLIFSNSFDPTVKLKECVRNKNE